MTPREIAMMKAATAIEDEAFRQYRASCQWEEAKDVIEGTDYCRLLDAAIAALAAAGMAVVERSRNKHVSCSWNPECDLVWAENRRIDDAKHTAAQAPGDG